MRRWTDDAQEQLPLRPGRAPPAPSAERVAEELLDTIHAAETALRMLGVEMDEAKRAVIEKNDARGYYGGDYGNTR